MITITLHERTVSQWWDKDAQEHVETVTDASVYVNPEQIVFIRDNSDAPTKYASHIRTVGTWDLFVVETPEEIQVQLRAARNEARWDLESAIASAIVDSRS